MTHLTLMLSMIIVVVVGFYVARKFTNSLAAKKIISLEQRIPTLKYQYTKTCEEYEEKQHHYINGISNLSRQKELLDKTDYITMEPQLIISNGSSDEQNNLGKVLKVDNVSPESLIKELRAAGSNDFAILYRKFKKEDPYVAYYTVVNDVVSKLKVHVDEPCTVYKMEVAIIKKIVSTMYDQMSPAQRDQLNAEIEEEAQKHGQSYGKLFASGGMLALAKASGFGLYLAASTAVGGITSALGVTLPFAFYTGMSSTIALFTGPFGLALLTILGLVMIGGTNYKKTIPSVVMIASIRARLEAERQMDLERVNAELEKMTGEWEVLKMTKTSQEEQLNILLSQLQKLSPKHPLLAQQFA